MVRDGVRLATACGARSNLDGEMLIMNLVSYKSRTIYDRSIHSTLDGEMLSYAGDTRAPHTRGVHR